MSNEVDELAELVRAMVREELAELGVGKNTGGFIVGLFDNSRKVGERTSESVILNKCVPKPQPPRTVTITDGYGPFDSSGRPVSGIRTVVIEGGCRPLSPSKMRAAFAGFRKMLKTK